MPQSILRIVRHIQLDLDGDLWAVLEACAQSQQTTIADLILAALRERYTGNRALFTDAMQAFVGIRNQYGDCGDATEAVRDLRRGTRMDRLR